MQVSRITVLPMGTLRMTASAYMFACSKESNANEDRTNIHPYYTLTVIGASASGCRAQIENTLHKTAPGCFQIIGADTPLQQFQPKHTSGIMVLLPELALLSDKAFNNIVHHIDGILFQQDHGRGYRIQVFAEQDTIERLHSGLFKRWVMENEFRITVVENVLEENTDLTFDKFAKYLRVPGAKTPTRGSHTQDTMKFSNRFDLLSHEFLAVAVDKLRNANENMPMVMPESVAMKLFEQERWYFYPQDNLTAADELDDEE